MINLEKSIKCAVFGVGRLGAVHAQNIAFNIPEAELLYVVASRKERAEKAAKLFQSKRWTTNEKEVFEDEEVDAIVIATPTNTHYELIKKAVAYKKDIFVDKPLTETIAQSEEVNRLISEANIKCMVGFMRRFDLAYLEAKKRIEAGDIGTPLYFNGLSRDPGSPPEEVIKNSGGIFLDLCIHDFDIARFLLAEEVKSITSVGSIQAHSFMHKYGDVDQANNFLEFENNKAASVEGSRISRWGYDVRGEVVGEDGALIIGGSNQNNLTFLNERGTSKENIPTFQDKFKDAFLEEMKYFVQCLKENEAPFVNEKDGLVTLKIAAAATKSYQDNEKVNLI